MRGAGSGLAFRVQGSWFRVYVAVFAGMKVKGFRPGNVPRPVGGLGKWGSGMVSGLREKGFRVQEKTWFRV